MLKRGLIGGFGLFLAMLAMSGTRADACYRDCAYPPYRLPLYFSNPLKTSWVYYPRNYGRRWVHARKVHCHHQHHYCDHRW
jgi:hypothetical protein